MFDTVQHRCARTSVGRARESREFDALFLSLSLSRRSVSPVLTSWSSLQQRATKRMGGQQCAQKGVSCALPHGDRSNAVRRLRKEERRGRSLYVVRCIKRFPSERGLNGKGKRTDAQVISLRGDEEEVGVVGGRGREKGERGWRWFSD